MNDTVYTACALYYGEKDAPEIIAKGERAIADEIIRIAREHDVAIIRDERTARSLMRLSVGDIIPHELYEAVSIILAFVYGRKAAA